MTTINIQVASKTFSANLVNNASSQALIAMLPMILDMIELNDTKYRTKPDLHRPTHLTLV